MHIDFGGGKFGDSEQAELHKKLSAALGLNSSELKVTRHAVDEAGRNLGHGRIWHPTKVQLNFNFVGTDAIEQRMGQRMGYILPIGYVVNRICLNMCPSRSCVRPGRTWQYVMFAR